MVKYLKFYIVVFIKIKIFMKLSKKLGLDTLLF